MRLEGKVAIVTGAGSGMGRASASLFAREGAKVIVADISSKGGEETVSGIRNAGGEATFVQVDVSKLNDLKRMVKTAVDAYGRLDILYNHAGMPGKAGIDDIEEAEYDLAMDVNLKGGFFGSKYAIPELKKSGKGSIIFTSSTSGVVGSISPVYSAGKGGVCTLTKSLAISLARFNIRVNCILPGPTDTPMLPKFMGGAHDPERFKKMIIDAVPLRRLCQPEEIARAALFLASDDSSFVTGILLPVDGGYLAR